MFRVSVEGKYLWCVRESLFIGKEMEVKIFTRQAEIPSNQIAISRCWFDASFVAVNGKHRFFGGSTFGIIIFWMWKFLRSGNDKFSYISRIKVEYIFDIWNGGTFQLNNRKLRSNLNEIFILFMLEFFPIVSTWAFRT